MPAAPGRTGAWRRCIMSSMSPWTRMPVASASLRPPWARCGDWPTGSSPSCGGRCRSGGSPSACEPIRRGCWRSAQPADNQQIKLKCHAPALFGRPEIFNTDQGCQFTSDDFIGVLKKSQIKISMDGKGRCMDNVFVERLWRSLKYEEVYLHAYASASEAKSGIGAWLHFYNEERPHQTHDYRTPRQVYEAQYRWICGRSALPTGCVFDHIPTGTTISKGFNNDGSKGIVTVAAPP